MAPDHALQLLEFFLKDYEFEIPTTRAVLLAIPDGGATYRPDPKSRSARELSLHIVSSEKWFLESLAAGQFRAEDFVEPDGQLKTQAEIVAWWDREIAAGLEKVKKLDAHQAAKILVFPGTYQLPAAVYMGWLIKHTVHHRGQLSAYLRAAGGKVPGIYGRSADEARRP